MPDPATTDAPPKPGKASDKKLKNIKVKDDISKGRTITGSKPDEIEVNPVMEAAEKKAVFAFGRFNPPTTGHEKLIHKVESEASKQGAQAHIIASHSEGTSKNPLPKEKKVEYLKKVAAKGTHVSASSSDQPTLLHHLSRLHKSGVEHVTIVSDKEKEFGDLAHRYNNVEGKHGHYNFKSINSISSGQRDPDAEGATGISGTKMREHARSGNMKAFKSGLPKALHPHAQEIASHIKSVKEENINDMFAESFDEDYISIAEQYVLENLIDRQKSLNEHSLLFVPKSVKESHFLNIDDFTVELINEMVALAEDAVNSIDRANTHLRDRGTTSLVDIYKHDTPGEKKMKKEDINLAFEAATDKEAIPRSGQPRKTIDYFVRSQVKRTISDKPYRQQMLQKQKIDEEEKPVWEKKPPKNEHKSKLSPALKAKAKARAKAAGRPYPNLVDNMWASRNEEYNTPAAEQNFGKPGHYDAIDNLNLNTANRNQTIKEYSYGPLNPNEDNNDFWGKKAELWNTTIEEAKKSRCRNCSAFNQSEEVLNKIHKALGPDGDKVTDLANLGFCEIFEFKCAGNRTCDAWLVGGPLKEEKGCALDEDMDEIHEYIEEDFTPTGLELYESWGELTEEAEKNGRRVQLNKPFLTPGGPKKRAVYVRHPETGNIVKVGFGDPNMRIKKNNPERRKSFRARHHCENPGPKHKARYWSCKQW